jgi:capsular polysaccharide biosynthesis protein
MVFLSDIAKALPHEGPPGHQKIFISRGDASLRKIANEEELILIAANMGFDIVRMTDFPARGQIDLVRDARILVGAHGMGLTHLIFNDGPLSLLELFHPELGTDAYSLIARAKAFDYDYVIGSKIDDNKGSYHIDPALFSAKMTAINGNYANKSIVNRDRSL